MRWPLRSISHVSVSHFRRISTWPSATARRNFARSRIFDRCRRKRRGSTSERGSARGRPSTERLIALRGGLSRHRVLQQSASTGSPVENNIRARTQRAIALSIRHDARSFVRSRRRFFVPALAAWDGRICIAHLYTSVLESIPTSKTLGGDSAGRLTYARRAIWPIHTMRASRYTVLRATATKLSRVKICERDLSYDPGALSRCSNNNFAVAVACSTVTVTKCQAALRTLQAFTFFRPTCLCREPHVDPDCNSFQNFLFDHPCVYVLNKKGKSTHIAAIFTLRSPTCILLGRRQRFVNFLSSSLVNSSWNFSRIFFDLNFLTSVYFEGICLIHMKIAVLLSTSKWQKKTECLVGSKEDLSAKLVGQIK